AEEPVEFEDVEVQLPVRIPRLVGQHQVDVVVEIAPRPGRAARKPQVHAVVDLLVAPIEAAVEIEHPGVALVHVLRGEAEHVIVGRPKPPFCLTSGGSPLWWRNRMPSPYRPSISLGGNVPLKVHNEVVFWSGRPR